jgi:hypothetical protein
MATYLLLFTWCISFSLVLWIKNCLLQLHSGSRSRVGVFKYIFLIEKKSITSPYNFLGFFNFLNKFNAVRIDSTHESCLAFFLMYLWNFLCASELLLNCWNVGICLLDFFFAMGLLEYRLLGQKKEENYRTIR